MNEFNKFEYLQSRDQCICRRRIILRLFNKSPWVVSLSLYSDI